MVFLRGIGSDLNLQDWLWNHIFPTEARWTDRGVRAASELAILEMLASGVTSFSDMYYHCDQTIEALCEAGMKANICRSTQGRPDLPFAQNADCREGLALFDRYHNYNGGKIRIDLCIHAEYTSTPETIEAYSAAAFEKGAGMHVHLSETRSEHEACVRKFGMTPSADHGCPLRLGHGGRHGHSEGQRRQSGPLPDQQHEARLRLRPDSADA